MSSDVEPPVSSSRSSAVVALLTTATMVAFAANSLLGRMALAGDLIDPVSFTTVRLLSGAIALVLISALVSKPEATWRSEGSWGLGLALFTYALAFSLAYVSLSAGMGALILFGSVQVVMIGAALRAGEVLRPVQWLGTFAALGGLVYLVLPGITAPDPLGAVLMGLSGIAWGVYSVRGKDARAPVAMTAGNFVRSAPLAIAASIVALSMIHTKPLGIMLALVSGVVTSGLGYALWYKALRGLTTTRASVVQLTVPLLAAFGGVVFLSETVSARLILSSVLILGGVALVVVNRKSQTIE